MTSSERRRKSRKGVATLSDADRDWFRDELKASRETAIAHLTGITIEDHQLDHAWTKPVRKFWNRLNTNVTAGFWEGVKSVSRWVIYVAGVALVAAFFGSAMSATVREWLAFALKAVTG
jgi:hypothetical protein